MYIELIENLRYNDTKPATDSPFKCPRFANCSLNLNRVSRQVNVSPLASHTHTRLYQLYTDI